MLMVAFFTSTRTSMKISTIDTIRLVLPSIGANEGISRLAVAQSTPIRPGTRAEQSHFGRGMIA